MRYISTQVLFIFLLISSLITAQDCAKVDFVYEKSGAAYTFKGTSDNIIQEWYWSFGDNKSEKGQVVKHVFEKDGEYEICVKGLVSNTCTAFKCKKIKVNTVSSDCNITADFTYKIENNIITYTAKSNAGETAKYYWSFGDGSSGDGQTVRHEYSERKAFEVCLRVLRGPSTTASNALCSTSLCKKIDWTNPCQIVADFTIEKIENTIKVYAKSIDNQTAKYYWSFGDGGLGEGKEFKYEYKSKGAYEICLKVVSATLATTTNQSCISTICKKVDVGNPCRLEVDFKMEVIDNVVKVYAKASTNASLKYNWSFGDGTRGEGLEFKHEYKNRGDYEICLTAYTISATAVTNACSTTICKKISIGSKINDECLLKADFTSTTVGNTFALSAKSNDPKATYSWYIKGQNDNKENVNGQNVKIQFDKNGVFEVCLITVDGAETCKIQVCKRVSVGSKIKIYPNPAINDLNVTSESKIIKYVVYNQAGDVKITSEVNGFSTIIDVSGLTEGIYHLKVVTEDGQVITQRFFKKN